MLDPKRLVAQRLTVSQESDGGRQALMHHLPEPPAADRRRRNGASLQVEPSVQWGRVPVGLPHPHPLRVAAPEGDDGTFAVSCVGFPIYMRFVAVV
jgi:hypothetical protein